MWPFGNFLLLNSDCKKWRKERREWGKEEGKKEACHECFTSLQCFFLKRSCFSLKGLSLRKKLWRFSHLRTMHLSRTVVGEECAFLLQSRKRIIGGKKESLRHDFSRLISGKRTCGTWRFGSWFPRALSSPGKPSESLHAPGQMSLHPSLNTTELLQLIYCNLPQFILIVSGRDQKNLWVLNSAPLCPPLPQRGHRPLELRWVDWNTVTPGINQVE